MSAPTTKTIGDAAPPREAFTLPVLQPDDLLWQYVSSWQKLLATSLDGVAVDPLPAG